MGNKTLEEVSKPGTRHAVYSPGARGTYVTVSQWLVGFSLVGLSRSQETTTDVLTARHCEPSLQHFTVFPSHQCSVKLIYLCGVSADTPHCWTFFYPI